MAVKVCFLHPLRAASKKCNRCEQPICKYCVRNVGSKSYCPDCKHLIRSNEINYEV